MSQIKNLLKTANNSKWLPILFFFLWSSFFILLSLLRDSRLDENIYFGDTVLISDLIQRGEWIGNYGVGLHGFINKLIIGLIFILTGPSVFITTLSNVVLGVLSGVVFYKLLLKHFRFSSLYSLLGVTLLFTSYQFVMYVPTYYRDIGALLFSLLVVESILSKRSKYVTGLLLLLVLDFKEHVFFTIALALGIWVVVEAYLINKNKLGLIVKQIFLSGLQLFLPSLVYLILMFTTSIIPLNIYDASIIGLAQEGLEKMISGFSIETATYNQDVQFNKEVAKMMPLINIPDQAPIVLKGFLSGINILLSYIGKLLYPRTFSIISIPFVIVVPSIYMAIKKFMIWKEEGKEERLVLLLILTIYIALYILRASLGRYLLPLSPLIFTFFLMFLKEIKRRKNFLKVLSIATILTIGELFFEYSYIGIKILLALIPLTFLYGIYVFKFFNKDIYKYLLVLFLSITSVGTSLLVSYRNGQIGSYIRYGYNRECEKVVNMVDKEDIVWINDIYWDRLPFILRTESVTDPEWRWELKSWVPKKQMLERTDDLRTYNFEWKDLEDFKQGVNERNINKILYIDLHVHNPEEKIQLQRQKEKLQEAKWLEMEQKIGLKNKTVYIFNVVEDV